MPARLRGIRIVLVEDHDDSRELLAFMLEQCGAEVVSASSARTGLQAVLDNFLAYLDKPVDPDRLCGAVAKVLDRSG